MILEIADLTVRPGHESAFEAAFAIAQNYIMSIDGYRGHELLRCHEQRNRYALLVKWDSLEAHTVGFRGSPQYQAWRALLHHLYDPFPEVLHYRWVETGATGEP